MSHTIYEGLLIPDNLGPAFDKTANPYSIAPGPGLLIDPITGKLKVDPAFIAANTPPPTVDIYTNAATYSAGILTLKDNSAATPDIPVDLGDLKRVAIANTASVVLSGNGETATPLAATVVAIPAGVPIPAAQLSGIVPAANLPPATGVLIADTASVDLAGTGLAGAPITATVLSIPAGVPIPAAQLQGVVPAANLPPNSGAIVTTTPSIALAGTGLMGAPIAATLISIPSTVPIPAAQLSGVVPAANLPVTTNTLAVAGANLVSTVNGIAASVPMASIVPATTHVNAWTKAGGLAESVDGVASNIAIASGTVADILGYNAAGAVVYGPAPAPVIVTDNANGTVTINAGAGQTQTVIRPIDEQTPSAYLTAADKFTVLDNGTLDHRSITLVELRRRLQSELATSEVVANAPGGVIPATKVVEGVTSPIDTYVDYNGSHVPIITLPAPVHNGQRLVFNHLTIIDTTVAVTNSSMTTPLLVTAATGGAEWIAINGKWHLTTERPTPASTTYLNTFRSTAVSATFAVPTSTIVGTTETITIEKTIEVTAANQTITLPAIPSALSAKMIGVPYRIKTTGNWVGTCTIAGAPAIDGAATYVINKVAALQPSITAEWTGSKWIVV